MSKNEPTLCIKSQGNTGILIVSLCVDDLIIVGNNQLAMIDKFKKDKMANFEMSNLGLMHYFLEMEVGYEEGRSFCLQKKYAKDHLLKRFNILCWKSIATPLVPNKKLRKEEDVKKVDASAYRSLVESLLHLYNTRPNILFATSLLSKFMQSLSQVHFGANKRVLRYFGANQL